MEYWLQRQLRSQEILTNKKISEVEKQIKKYYESTLKSVIRDFESTYDKVLLSIEEGREPTPADLYKLDKYWQMQAQTAARLEQLGNKEIKLLSKKFVEEFNEIYEGIALKTDLYFGRIDEALVKEMIERVWCADGISWSKRIWKNIEQLKLTLDEGLIECLVTGKKTTQLKQTLMQRFDVSYSRAKTLVQTEMAHIQTTAAAKRYQDYGIEQYEILGREEDECGAKVECHKMHGKKFFYSEMKVGTNAPPFHPNCRCAIAPVIE